MLEISDTNKLERLRIYKTKNTKFKFNPDKELINKYSKVLYSKVQLIFPESVNEKKAASLLCKYSKLFQIEEEKFYFSVNNSETHYGSHIELSDKKIKYSFLTN